jgi:hypothetical protein
MARRAKTKTDPFRIDIRVRTWGGAYELPTLSIDVRTLATILLRENSVIAPQDVGLLLHALASYAEGASLAGDVDGGVAQWCEFANLVQMEHPDHEADNDS